MKPTKKQEEAIKSNAQSTLVIAGPGTGKTHILASRVEFIVKEQKINPENILCLTYTNAGAITMKKRIIQFLGGKGRDITTSTFHAFASSLIQEYPDVFGYSNNAQQASDIDQALITKEIIDKLYNKGELKNLSTANDRYFYEKEVQRNIDTLKSENISPEKYIQIVNPWQQEYDNMPDEEKLSSRGKTKGQVKADVKKIQERINKNKEFSILYEKYEQELRNRNVYDYADMINKVIYGLDNNETVKKEIQDKYKSILVDEYQDTNGSQNKLLFHLLDHKNHNCFVVGDDDQAINRFQGATIENFTDFLDKFPKTKIISLEDNFRSPQAILDSAFHFIQNNKTRINNKIDIPPKKLIAKGKTANNKEYFINKLETDIEEKAFMISKIIELQKQGVKWNEIAILTRQNKEQESIAKYLYSHNIPYAISGTQNALEQNVVISFLNILKCCHSPSNGEYLEHFLRHPATSITAEDTITVLAQRSKNKTSLYKEFKKIIPTLKDKDKAQETLDILYNLYKKQESSSALSYIHIIAEETGYMSWILSQDNKIELLNNIVAIYEETARVQKLNPRISIKQLISHFESFYKLKISLKSSIQNIELEDAVRVLTAHQSKGKEFEYVFITNTIQNIWAKDRKIANKLPLHPSIKMQDTDIEDERRLFFVALTRAKKGLFISYAQIQTEGLIKNREVISSEFLYHLMQEVPEKNEKISNIEKFIEKTISQPLTTNYSSNIKATIQEIIKEPSFKLGATNINNFLECPNQFLYSSILRVPSTHSINQSLVYGTAVHYALQKYFETKKEKRSFDFFLHTIEEHIQKESMLSEEENYYIIERAREKMKAYYNEKLQKEKDPLYTEKNISTEYKNIPLTGKIDKISIVQNNEVEIVDYKTSKKPETENAILGRTKSTEGTLLKVYNQLMFYKLLTSRENSLAQYKATKFIIDYVDAMKERDIPIDENDYERFLQTIEKIWKSIQDLSFLESTEEFPFCNKCQYCTEIKK